jgi:hypothetical protein
MYARLLISKSWILSKTAQRVYLWCAILTLAEFGLVIAVQAAITAAEARELTGIARAVVQVLVVPAVTGTAVLLVAMWYFWFGYDRSHWLKKALWFLLLGLLAPIGAVLYFFFVYRHSPALGECVISERQDRAAAAK